jgi:hypothetical protein
MNPLYILYYSHLTGKDLDSVIERLQTQGIYTHHPDQETRNKIERYVELEGKRLNRHVIIKETGLYGLQIKTLESMKFAHDNNLKIVFIHGHRKVATPEGSYLIRA